MQTNRKIVFVNVKRTKKKRHRGLQYKKKLLERPVIPLHFVVYLGCQPMCPKNFHSFLLMNVLVKVNEN